MRHNYGRMSQIDESKAFSPNKKEKIKDYESNYFGQFYI